MLIVFVHGWGVKGAGYGALPRWLAQQTATQGSSVVEVWLSDYISYSDQVTIDDLVRAFESARQAQFPDQRFACITHSTGGPILREWLDRYHASANAPQWLTHLIMLAPPNHGSALAQLGKGRLSRMAFWARGMEPGEKVLDWLELGSASSWDLNQRSIDTDWTARGVFLFVLTGGNHDPKLYDHLNSYTGEQGTDGVVRAASANLNYRLLTMQQTDEGTVELTSARRSPRVAFGILADTAHTGKRRGILASLTQENAANHPVARWVGQCLSVDSATRYEALSRELEVQSTSATQPCSMLVFRVNDFNGHTVDDYDLLLTSGSRYRPDALPRGFFIDRQRNQRSPSSLTYYINHQAMNTAQNLGFRISPRPASGPVRYQPAEFRSDLAQVAHFLAPHETAMVEITLQRKIDPKVFEIRRAA